MDYIKILLSNERSIFKKKYPLKFSLILNILNKLKLSFELILNAWLRFKQHSKQKCFRVETEKKIDNSKTFMYNSVGFENEIIR